MARVLCLLSRLSKVRIPFSHLATAAKVIGLTTTTTTQRVVMMDYRLGSKAKPLSTYVVHYANRLRILIGIELGRLSEGFPAR